MREEYLTYVREYVNRLEPYMNTLQEQGLWKRVKFKSTAQYFFAHKQFTNECILCNSILCYFSDCQESGRKLLF